MDDKIICRIKFKKTGVMKFVGHLDTMRYFQKAIRRAGIPAAYSQGFHPHMQMSFALPLGVGVTTEGDYFDLELDPGQSEIDTEQIKSALQEQMAEGTEIIDVILLPPKAKKAMAAVSAASYRVTVYNVPLEVDCEKLVSVFLEQNEIIIEKKTKKSVRTLDLKPLIYDLTVFERNESFVTFDMQISAGSSDNIKPQLVLEHLFNPETLENQGFSLGIHRLDLLKRNDDGKLISLNNF